MRILIYYSATPLQQREEQNGIQQYGPTWC